MTNYTDEFIAESLELLAKLESNLLILEENATDQLALEELLRGIHTLKGSSGMYGFEKVGHLMHAIENIFDLAKTQNTTIGHSIINLALEAIDFAIHIFNTKNDVGTSNESELELLLKRIDKHLNKNKNQQTPDADDINEHANTTPSTYYISFKIDSHFETRGINLASIFSELETNGTAISIPFKNSEDIINEWEIFYVSTLTLQDIEDIFIFLLDVATIELLSAENLFLNDQFKSIIQKNISLKIKNNLDELKDIINELKEEKQTREASSNLSNLTTRVNKDFLRVAAEKLDEQMDLLSELVTAKAELRMVVESEKYAKLYKLVESLDKITNSFRKNILNTRLVQVKNWYVPFLRLIRDISKQLDKEVEFVTEGLDTEIDKNIIDSLEGPLTHIIRNSLDHGIESKDERVKTGKPAKGQIKLKAYHSGSEIFIEIQDDGRGIDPKKIKEKALKKGLIDSDTILTEELINEIIFTPGFSTANAVTEVSGRGVGMDVLRKAINQLRGEIEIKSAQGKGTKVIIKLPMLLSIIDTLLIRSDEQYFAIPLPEVQKCTQITAADLLISDNEQLQIDNDLIPYLNLRQLFSIKSNVPDKQKIIIIQNGNKRIGLITDEVIGEYQAVLKPFDGFFINKHYFIGASLLADGHLCVILDTGKLLNEKIKHTI